MNRRQDYKTALLIDAVLYSTDPDVRGHAAGALTERNISHEVTTRVFMLPSKRRHCELMQPESSLA
jgi:hypothetical protein